VLRANLGFRAVALGPGRHAVRMRYRTPAVTWGVGISAAAAVALVVLAARRERRGESGALHP
jgi:hypothetical protein